MSRSALRHPALVVGVATALGAATIAPVAAAASTPKPAAATVTTQGLLGGLLGAVTQPVVELVTPLVNGSTGVLPAVLPPATITALTDALTGVTGTVDALVPKDVTSLLSVLTPAQVQQIATNPAAVAPLLEGLLPTLTSLAGGSTLSSSAVTSALSQLTSVLGGGVPSTASGLATLTSLLDQVTSLLGYPSVASLPVVGPLLGVIAQTGKAVPDGPAKTAAVGALTTAGTSLGLTPAQIQSALDLLGLGRVVAKTPATTPATPATGVARTVRAKIVSVKVSKNRKKISVRVSCPATAGAAGCTVKPSVKIGSRTAKTTKSAVIKRGKTKTFSATVPAAAVKSVKKSGGRVVAKVTTVGSTAGAVSKTVKVRRAA
ncbi:hypothetical protein [Patulibacter minatonensis]|uniref:hypothetical protein n=1 Tax=Patulibacter minatonensis TaxID=298163 RepID=UPI00047A8BFB|nr:hypothetical protein [Patulibacter minatonensis]